MGEPKRIEGTKYLCELPRPSCASDPLRTAKA
jgi:hypothetical protein